MKTQTLHARLLLAIGSLLAGLALQGSWAAEVHSADKEDTIDWKKEREFWAFHPPVPKSPAVVKNKRWPAQPLDFLVLARLEQTNLAPTAAADKRTLIRRVTFDLTG